jgi:glutaredoxin
MTIVMYSKTPCRPCDATKRRFTEKALEPVIIDLTPVEDHDEEGVLEGIRSELRDAGYMESPVVKVYDNDEEVDAWHGYRPDRIDHWANVRAA